MINPMTRMTWALIVPLIPATLLGVLFPNSTFNLVTQVTGWDILNPDTKQKISAAGPMGLYFSLVLISIIVTKINKLDQYSNIRRSLAGEWDFIATDQSQHGRCTIRLDKATQKIFINGNWSHGNTPLDGWRAGQIFLEDDKLSFVVTPNNSDKKRALVEFHIPQLQKKLTHSDGSVFTILGTEQFRFEATKTRSILSVATSGHLINIYFGTVAIISVAMLLNYYNPQYISRILSIVSEYLRPRS